MILTLLSIAIGACGTWIGCFLLYATGDFSAKSIHHILAFAGGLMLSIVCFDLVPEAISLSGILQALLGVAVGGVFIFLTDIISHKITEPHDSHHHDDSHHGHGAAHHTHDHHDTRQTNEEAYIRSGFMMLIAISLHNFPEGVAIGLGGAHDVRLGVMLAATIALHNLPIGMAIAAPLKAGNTSRRKALLLTALSGVPSVLGGVVGALISNQSDLLLAVSLAGAGGTMLYAALVEIIPQSWAAIKPGAALRMIFLGILLGLFL